MNIAPLGEHILSVSKPPDRPKILPRPPSV